jgi:hypothetical protein
VYVLYYVAGVAHSLAMLDSMFAVDTSKIDRQALAAQSSESCGFNMGWGMGREGEDLS